MCRKLLGTLIKVQLLTAEPNAVILEPGNERGPHTRTTILLITDQIIDIDLFAPCELFADDDPGRADDPATCSNAGDLVTRFSLGFLLGNHCVERVLRPKLNQNSCNFR